MTKIIALIAVFGFASTVATAGDDESLESLARQSYTLFAAFECSEWAVKIGEYDAGDRLFEYGYEQGIEFFEAIGRGEMTDEEIAELVHSRVALVAYRGNTRYHFIMGRVFQMASQSVLDQVSARLFPPGTTISRNASPEGASDGQEYAQTVMREIYAEKNCAILVPDD